MLFILLKDEDTSKAVNQTRFACALKCCGRYLLLSSSAIVCLCSLQMKYDCFYTQMDAIKVLFFSLAPKMMHCLNCRTEAISQCLEHLQRFSFQISSRRLSKLGKISTATCFSNERICCFSSSRL